MKIQVFVSAELDPDFVSSMIMKKIGSDYSHIGLLIDDSIIWHHVDQGICFEKLEDFLKTHRIALKDVSNSLVVSEDFIRGYLLGSEGKEYSISQYLGFVFTWTQKFLANGKAKGICSEFVSDFLKTCTSIKTPCGDFVSPTDVWEAIPWYA